MIAANDYIDPMLPRLSGVQLRTLIAQASGLLWHKNGADELRTVLVGIERTLPPAGGVPVQSMRAAAVAVSMESGYSLDELRGPRRFRGLAHARQAAYARAYATGNVSLSQIGRFFGGRDHGTVHSGIRAHKSRTGEGA